MGKENRGIPITMPWQTISSRNHPVVPLLRAVSAAFLMEPVSSVPEPTPCLWEFLFFGANKKKKWFPLQCNSLNDQTIAFSFQEEYAWFEWMALL